MSVSDHQAHWLTGHEYDALRATDFDLFCEAAARDLAAHVPTCPDWDVSNLCDHLARVYQGRAFTVQNGTFADPSMLQVRSEPAEPLEWVKRWSYVLDEVLRNHPDTDTTVTFMPDSTSMLFWRRRMALETLVHRVDAELAVDMSITPMDESLSADGVAELLWFCTDLDQPIGDALGPNTSVALVVGGRRFVATVSGDSYAWEESPAHADAEVSGSAGDVLLALSGRDVKSLTISGDASAWQRLLNRAGCF
jgi:uncharacterized protein (TIGR03083 family)